MAEPKIESAGGRRDQPFIDTLTFVICCADGLTTSLIYFWGLPAADRSPMLASGCLMIGVFTGTLMHELGHAIAALICGWRVIIFAVRPFALRTLNANLVYAGKQNLPGRLGFVVAVPKSKQVLTLARWIAFVAGGPIASLFFALYLGIVAFALAHAAIPLQNIGFLIAICTGFGVHSFCVAVLNLLPRWRVGGSSDGAKLVEAWRHGRSAPQLGVSFWLLALSKYRIRPRDLPDWMLKSLPADPAHQRLHDAMAISRILDAKSPDYGKARQKIEAFRKKNGISEWLCGCDAFVAAIHEADTIRATAALAVPHQLRPVPELTLAARAALSARLGLANDTKHYLSEMDGVLAHASPFHSRCYADIRRIVEFILRSSLQNRADRTLSARGSVPVHVE